MAALETGRTSWTALLDAIRLQPGADVAAVTTAQIRDVVERLIAAGQWRNGDPEILVVLDAGYDAPRIAYLLARPLLDQLAAACRRIRLIWADGGYAGKLLDYERLPEHHAAMVRWTMIHITSQRRTK